MELIYVHIGDKFPEHHQYSLNQSRKYFSGNIRCIAGDEANQLLDRNDNNRIFNQISFLNKYGFGNFWSVTCQRLFVIEQIMKEQNLKEIIHIENDILIYDNPEAIRFNFEKFSDDTLVINSLTNELSTAAYIYIPNYQSIKRVNNKIIKYLTLGEDELIKLSNTAMINEMSLLKLVEKHYPEFIKYLPSYPDELNEYFSSCYDPASWGQFVGGTPNYLFSGFIDDRHIIGQQIRQNNYKVVWSNKEPYILDENKKLRYKLANLHIHSKELHKYISY